MKQKNAVRLRKLADELFSARSVGEFDIDASGNIVFSSNETGQWQLYVMKTTGGSRFVKQVTNGTQSKIAPHFIKRGKGIIFFTDYDGNEKYDIRSIDVTGDVFADSINLMPDTDFIVLPDGTPSKDGGMVAYVSDESNRFAAYVLNTQNGKKSKVTNHIFSDSDATVSPDGRLVAVEYLANEQEIYTSVYSVPDSSELFTVGKKDFGKPINAAECSWSTQGEDMLFSSAEKGVSNIAAVNIRTQRVRWLTDLKEECYEPVASPDGRWVAFTNCRRGSVILSAVSLKSWGRQPLEITDLFNSPGLASSPKFSADGNVVYFLVSGPSDTQDIWSYSLVSGKSERLTNHTPESLRNRESSIGTEVICINPVDGKNIPALLFLATGSPGSSNGRGVVYLHGGPTSLTVNSWNPIIQLLVGEGVNVIAPNYRGSTGYGRAYRDANRHVMGNLDVTDCVAARNYLVENRLAVADNIAVTGASYGGYLTMCCLTFHPGLWRCGSAGVPFLNWFTEMESERGDLHYWDIQNMGDPEKDADRLRRASPFFYMENIDAPVQIIAGGNDPRCPLEESESAVKRLKSLGKEVDFKFYDGEGHWFRKLENSVDADSRAFLFIMEHLSVD